MAVRKRRSKIFRVLLSVVLLLVLVVAALPLWFPWALRPIAKRYGATYANYQRVGYQRFQLSGFALTNRATQVQADRVTAFVPTVWLWRHLVGMKNEPFVEARSWKYVSAKATSSQLSRQNAPVSVYGVFEKIKRTAATLQNWLPTAALTNGAISIKGQTVDIPQTSWANATLKATVSLPDGQPMTMLASTKKPAWELNFDSEIHQFRSTVSIEERNGTLAVEGAANWLTNHLDAVAEFPKHGVIPESGSLRSASFRVPARLLGWNDYGDLGGTLQADYRFYRDDWGVRAHTLELAYQYPAGDRWSIRRRHATRCRVRDTYFPD